MKLKANQDEKGNQMKGKRKGHDLDLEKGIVITEVLAIQNYKGRTARGITETIQLKSEIATDTEKMNALITMTERIQKTDVVRKSHY